MKFVFKSLIIISCLAVVLADHLPNIFKICSRDDPEINECLKNAIQSAMESLATGYNESDFEIPAIEPYREKEVKIEYKRNQILAKFTLKNIKAFGFSKSKVLAVRANLDDRSMNLEVDITNPELYLESLFRGEGHINAIVFKNKGNLNITMSDLEWTWKIMGVPEIKDDKIYMKIKKFSMSPTIGHMDLNLPVLFKENLEFNKFAQNFMKQYWKVIYEEMHPLIDDLWEKIGSRMCNRVFPKIPYDELFPPTSA